jgi:ADP-ribose pyrophosphatase
MQSRKRYFELKDIRPEWFVNSLGGYEILFLEDEMNAAEDASWKRLQNTQQKYPELSHASIDWVRVGVVVETQYLLLIRDAVRFPGGALGTYERVVNRPEAGPGAAVFVQSSDDRILLLNQHRHALRRFAIEAPRGFAEPGEDGLATAVREVAEEMQGVVRNISYLGSVAPDSGLMSHIVKLVHADIEAYGEVESQESIAEVISLSIEELQRKIAQDEIVDGFTLALYAKAIAKGIIRPLF